MLATENLENKIKEFWPKDGPATHESLITINPAKILGIDDEFGSIEIGKSATLFISKGDALDIVSNNVTHAFISGRNISLETHQTRLWRRYSNKYSSSQ